MHWQCTGNVKSRQACGKYHNVTMRNNSERQRGHFMNVITCLYTSREVDTALAILNTYSKVLASIKAFLAAAVTDKHAQLVD